MSDYEELVKQAHEIYNRWNNPPSTELPDGAGIVPMLTRAIEALIRERDEAKEELSIWQSVFPDIAPRAVIPTADKMLKDARALGYREGLEKAVESLQRQEHLFTHMLENPIEAIRALIPESK